MLNSKFVKSTANPDYCRKWGSMLVGQSNKPYLHITPILTYTADAAKLLQHCKTTHSKAKLKS